jgi:hypothetical protein
MGKFEMLDALLEKNKGYLRTSEVTQAGVSRPYLSQYVHNRKLERVSHGLYKSQDAWDDGMYVLQARYPLAVFSHETALYLQRLAAREPIRYSLTLKAGSNTTGLSKQGVMVYKIKAELFEEGIMKADSPAGHAIRVYNAERTICDLLRSRRNIEIQDLQEALKGYVRSRERNIPLLMRYASLFSVEKITRQYVEVLLP